MSVQTRGRLLEAAKRVFSEKGYHGAQISHIIDEAGVARGTFYLHFRSKEEIFKELLKEVVEELKERIRVIDPSGDPIQQITENIARVVEFALEERELARIVLQRNSDPRLFSATDRFFDEVAAMIEGSIKRGVAMGVLRECDTEITARSILGAVKETIRWLLNKEDIDTFRIARELVEFGMRGLRRDAQGGGNHEGSGAL